MPPIDLNALLASARTQVRLAAPKTAFKAKVAQRDLATIRSEEYAQSLAKRNSLANALSHESVDAMRFRWLATHRFSMSQYIELGIESVRRAIDHAIAHEAAQRIAALRKERL